MDLIPDTGKIVWTPMESQTGIHEITVSLFDGYETVEMTFRIDVVEASSTGERSFAAPIAMAVSVILFLIIIVIIGAVVLSRRKGKEEEAPEKPSGSKYQVTLNRLT